MGFDNSKIARQLVLYILICSSLVTLVLTALQLMRDYRLEVSSINQRIEQVGIADLPSLSEAFWVLDIEALRKKLDGLVRLQDMQYLDIVDAQGDIVVRVGEKRQQDILEHEFPLEYTHRNEAIPLGRLCIQASLVGVYQRLWDRVVVILISQGAKTFLVSLCILLIVQWLLTRHLKTIAEHANNINIHAAHRPLELNRKPSYWTSNDELQQVVDALNRMQTLLWSAYQKSLQHRDELERKVHERTLELEQINQELSSFCYSVSHDLRTPLRSINGFSQLVLDEYASVIDGEGKEYLQRVKSAALRMGELIDDLLSLSRVSQAELELQDIDLSQLCQDIVAQLQADAPQREVEIIIHPQMHSVGDVHLIKIALENLIGNAWKYTSRTARPHIECGLEHRGDETVYFIRDNGVGFDMHYHDKIFDVFQRLHGREEFEGTGIGLATVERIIKRHKGQIWAMGEPNRGATFYFTLARRKPYAMVS